MARFPRLKTDGGDALGQNPFAGLEMGGLAKEGFGGVSESVEKPARAEPKAKTSPKGGRLELRREKAGRGGKTVTTLRGVEHWPAEERTDFLRFLRKGLSTGGGEEDGVLILQGDVRQPLKERLTREGFKVVLAGG